MTESQFYRRSLAVPLVVPAIAFALTKFGLGGSAVEVLVWSLMVGGVPYAFLVMGVLIWARNRPADALRRLSWLMPLLMAVVFMAFFLIGGAGSGGSLLREFGPYVAFILIMGYTYVIVVNIVAGVLRTRGAFDVHGA